MKGLYKGQLRLRPGRGGSAPGRGVDCPVTGARAVAACKAAAAAAERALALEEAVRLYRPALEIGDDEVGEDTGPGWS